MVFAITAAMAEFERDLVRERTMAVGRLLRGKIVSARLAGHPSLIRQRP